MRMTIQEIADAVHPITLPSISVLEHTIVTGVSTDTRAIEPGDLFVALSGPNFDGHDYVSLAFDQGASAAVVDAAHIDDLPKNRGILITVPDTKVAYGDIALYWRQLFKIPVIAVTGSVGKTTTKDMLASVLAPLGPVLKTEVNENNEIGVPKLLLRMNGEHRAVIVEMGMRGVGEIAHLARISEPTIGVITMIAENHIELLGSKEAIADAKGELIDQIPPSGLIILNADDPMTPRLQARAKCRVQTFGFSPSATLSVKACEQKANSHIAQIMLQGLSEILHVPSPARHDVSNALAAVLVAVELGLTIEEIDLQLGGFAKGPMRMEVLTTGRGATILSDCYNASPTSMKSALDTIAAYPAVGKKVAFLGDMRELGAFAPEMHKTVAEHADKLGIEIVYAVGPLASEHYSGARKSFSDSDEAASWARTNIHLATGDVALVKGSRALLMERIVEALTQPE